MPPFQRSTDQPIARALSSVEVPRVDSIAAFGQQVSRHLARCRRQGGRLAVLWIEADLQEPPGSHWPAEARQAQMQAFSRRLKNRVRGNDEVLQVGDTCFAVLLQFAGSSEAAIVEDRLRRALKGAYDVDGRLMHATLSMGSATFPESGRHGAELAEVARQNCFAATACTPQLACAQTSSHSLRM